MTEQEVNQILKSIERLETKVVENHRLLTRNVEMNHQLVVGNGNRNAVLPRLHALETFIGGVPTWQRFGEKIITPVLTAVITAVLMWFIFGQP